MSVICGTNVDLLFRMTKYFLLWEFSAANIKYYILFSSSALLHSSSVNTSGLLSFILSSFCCFKSWKNLFSATTVALSFSSSPTCFKYCQDKVYHHLHLFYTFYLFHHSTRYKHFHFVLSLGLQSVLLPQSGEDFLPPGLPV